MKKIALVFILVLILSTSLIKNSTKEIEDKTFRINENIRSLKTELGEAMLEHDYLSNPKKLQQYRFQYFKNELTNIDITKIKMISEKKNIIEITNFLDELQVNE
tara:strand:+ start:364 stop:675 length:312 start_codon:yes stop_codon:yes gene_type:complete